MTPKMWFWVFFACLNAFFLGLDIAASMAGVNTAIWAACATGGMALSLVFLHQEPTSP